MEHSIAQRNTMEHSIAQRNTMEHSIAHTIVLHSPLYVLYVHVYFLERRQTAIENHSKRVVLCFNKQKMSRFA